MNYGRYLKQCHISDSKLYILQEIFKGCRDIPAAISRLNELSMIIRDNNQKSGIILSTIHSSKGLEYKNVYLIDIIDGIFPESGDITKEDFEEMRRIFYVGVTRAKDNLFLFRTGDTSQFIDELAVKKGSLLPSYDDYITNLFSGQKVVHQMFGKGTVTALKIPFVSIKFSDKERTFGIKGLYDKNLLEFIDS